VREIIRLSVDSVYFAHEYSMKKSRRPQGQQATLEWVIGSNDNFMLATGSQFERTLRNTAREIDKIQRWHR